MTINEVFKHMTDIINYHLFPFLRTKHIEHKHRVFVEDFIRQLYDTLNTALKGGAMSSFAEHAPSDFLCPR